MEDIYSKVLFIGPLNSYGGIGAVLRTYQKNIKHFNFIPTHKDQSKIQNIFHFIYSLFEFNYYIISNKQIKIVHIHSASKGSFVRKIIIAMIAKIYGKKVILHMHGGQFKEYINNLSWSKFIFIYLMNQVDLFICLTEGWECYYKNHLGLKNVAILGNPVKIEDNLFQKPPSDELSLLFLGTLNDKKGIFDFLDYISTNEHFKNYKIHLKIGGTGETERLINSISDTKYLNQIEYLGFVSGDQKHEAIKACDMFILPSYYEGLPVSILEAMGHGKPVIATNVGGVSSVVKEHSNGWLFEPGNFQQLDIIFDEIVKKQFHLDQYQLNAYHIAGQYACQNILIQLSNEYKKLLN